MIISRNTNKIEVFSYVFFGFIFCLISLTNHYCFRTYAWDLGINNNAIFDYSHFRWNHNKLLPDLSTTNILGDHFSIYPIIVSPFTYLFGTYTMLVFQIAMILLGGRGVYKLILYNTNSKNLAILSLLSFFSIWGIYSALSFDYHDNVIAAMIVPWLFYYLAQGKYVQFFIVGCLIMIGKENMALWLAFICIGMLLLNLKDKTKCYATASLSVVALLYFIVVVSYVIPALSNSTKGYLHFNYLALGSNFKEAILRIFNDPIYVFKLLYINHTGNVETEGIKTELYKVFFLSGGALLIFKPQYFIMLLPIFAQKMFNDDFAKWGINVHYSIEFAPIVIIGAFDVIQSKVKNIKFQNAIGFVVFVSVFYTNYSSIESRVSKWYDPESLMFYDKSHYETEFNIKEVYKAMELIPKNVSLSASDILVPHLALRDNIYQFPVINNAEYIAIINHSRSYPLNNHELTTESNKLANDKNWRLIYNQNSMMIFHKENLQLENN